jgi:hypothetical protein
LLLIHTRIDGVYETLDLRSVPESIELVLHLLLELVIVITIGLKKFLYVWY